MTSQVESQLGSTALRRTPPASCGPQVCVHDILACTINQVHSLKGFFYAVVCWFAQHADFVVLPVKNEISSSVIEQGKIFEEISPYVERPIHNGW